MLIVSGNTDGVVSVNKSRDQCGFILAGVEVPEDVESDVRRFYVSCHFDGANKADGVQKGQLVRVKGRFVNNIAGQILLRDCELLK